MTIIIRSGEPERGGAHEGPSPLPKPGRGTRQRLRLGAIDNLNSVERGFSRAICPDAFFDGRRLAASGIAADKSGTLQVQPPISFLGLGRALQPAKQPRSGLTDGFHDPISFRNAHASCLQNSTGAHGNARKVFGEIRNVEC